MKSFKKIALLALAVVGFAVTADAAKHTKKSRKPAATANRKPATAAPQNFGAFLEADPTYRELENDRTEAMNKVYAAYPKLKTLQAAATKNSKDTEALDEYNEYRNSIINTKEYDAVKAVAAKIVARLKTLTAEWQKAHKKTSSR